MWQCLWSWLFDWFGGVGGAKRTGLLGIGRAAEHLPDHLCDGVTVDAVDFEQVGHFAAAGNLSDSQTLESDAGFIDDSGAHRLSQATCGITAGKHVNGAIIKEYHTRYYVCGSNASP